MKRTSVNAMPRLKSGRFVRGFAVGAGLALLPIAAAVAQSLPSGLSSPGASDLRSEVQQAIGTNPEVQAAWRELQAAGQDRRAAWGHYLPSVDVNAGVGREDRQHDGRGSFDTDYAELALSQMLYDGFATASEVSRLDRAELVRYYELLGASEQVALDAVRAYLDVQRYRELVRLAQDNYAKHLEVFNQIEARTLSGAGRGVDLGQIATGAGRVQADDRGVEPSRCDGALPAHRRRSAGGLAGAGADPRRPVARRYGRGAGPGLPGQSRVPCRHREHRRLPRRATRCALGLPSDPRPGRPHRHL